MDIDAQFMHLRAKLSELEDLITEVTQQLRGQIDSAVRAAAFELRDHERRLHD